MAKKYMAKNLNAIFPAASNYLISCAIILAAFFNSARSANTERTEPNHQFRASVVKVDITPTDSQPLLGYIPRSSNGVLDHIYHRIVALDDGTTQLYLISTDICVLSSAEYDRMAEKIQKQLGINPVNLWWTTTHTHSAPEVGPIGIDGLFHSDRYAKRDLTYSEIVEQKLIDGIKQAKEQLVSARIGASWGYSRANINRRAKDIVGDSEGPNADLNKYNSRKVFPRGDVGIGMDPDGATDRKIGLLRIEKEDGSPLVLIVNYPIHGTCLSPKNQKISGDIPGLISEYVEKNVGVPCLFINGSAGNLAPIYSHPVFSQEHTDYLSQFRVMLGQKVLEANKKITATTDKVSLTADELIVETPRKPGLKWSEEFSRYARTTAAGINLVRIPIRFLNINNEIAIWGTPLELFCEISNEVRERSPFPYTFAYGYTNGWMGYMPTKEEFKYEGYEVSVSILTPQAAEDLTEAVVAHLLEIKDKHK